MSGRRAAINTMTLGMVGGPTKEEKAKAASSKEERVRLKTASGLIPRAVKKAVSRDGSTNMMKPYSALSKTWSMPSFMASVNTPIVHATAHQLGYGATEGMFAFIAHFTSFSRMLALRIHICSIIMVMVRSIVIQNREKCHIDETLTHFLFIKNAQTKQSESTAK